MCTHTHTCTTCSVHDMFFENLNTSSNPLVTNPFAEGNYVFVFSYFSKTDVGIFDNGLILIFVSAFDMSNNSKSLLVLSSPLFLLRPVMRLREKLDLTLSNRMDIFPSLDEI